ncbi:MAG: EpsG family protein [Neisseriales bacterium]|nr:MAG: EpsG family protein [Neisseriales bacterium]
MIYWLFFISLGILSWANINFLLEKNVYIVYSLIVLIFLGMSFLRWERGTDWDSYYIVFLSSANALPREYEIGFGYLNYFTRNITDSFTVFLFINGLILYLSKYQVVYKFSIFPIVSLWVYFSTGFGDIFFVRQNVAVAITFIALFFVIKRRPIYFTLTVVCAAFIHISALAFLISYKIYYLKLSKKSQITLCFLTLILLLIVSLLQNELFNLFARANILLLAKFATYFNSSVDQASGAGSPMFILIKGLLNRVLMLLLIRFIAKWIPNYDNDMRGFINIYVIGIIFFALTALFSPSLGRIGYYFFSVEGILIANLFSVKYTPQNKTILFLIVLVYLFVRFYGVLYGEYSELYLPYNTIWD